MASPRSAGGTSLTRCAVDQEIARGDLLEPGDHPQQGGLAAAGRTDEDAELAVLDLEVDALDDLDVAVALADVLECDGGHDTLLPFT